MTGDHKAQSTVLKQRQTRNRSHEENTFSLHTYLKEFIFLFTQPSDAHAWKKWNVCGNVLCFQKQETVLSIINVLYWDCFMSKWFNPWICLPSMKLISQMKTGVKSYVFQRKCQSASDVRYCRDISFLWRIQFLWPMSLEVTAPRRKANLPRICATSLVILFEDEMGHFCSCVTSSLKINWRRRRGWSKKPKADSSVLSLQTFVLGWCQEHLDPVAHIMQYPLGRCASMPAFFVSIFHLSLPN